MLDSNILIDGLNRHPAAVLVLETGDDQAISVMSWLEVLAGIRSREGDVAIREWLGKFEVVQVTADVSERALELRRTTSLKLVDAIILASAQVTDRQLYTRNTKDFRPDWPGVIVPYTL